MDGVPEEAIKKQVALHPEGVDRNRFGGSNTYLK